MHQLLLRLDQRSEEPDAFVLEGSEIGPLRNAAVLAQPLKDVVERGFGGEPLRFDAPQSGKGGIEESEPPVGTVDGNSGADPFEHGRMSADVTPELGLRR